MTQKNMNFMVFYIVVIIIIVITIIIIIIILEVGPRFSNDPFFFDYRRLAGFLTFGRKFQRSTGNSNYHRIFP